MHTSLLSVDVGFDVGLFEWAPFEVFPVTAALHLALCALLTSRFLFATLQSFRFASHAAWDVTLSVHILSCSVSYARGGHGVAVWMNAVIHTIATLRLLGLGRPVDSGGRRLFTHRSLLR